ncbi:MAG TPA: regulatory protein RecX [Cellvibrionaceae bacterium]
MNKPYTPQSLYQYTLMLLSRREYSQAELRQKLTHRFGNEAVELIHKTLSCLAADNYQSDDRFTDSYVYSRLQKGFGLNRIKLELRQKGIDQERISETLENENTKEQEQQQLERIWRRKFNVIPSNSKERYQQQYYLANKGFRKEIIELFFLSV